jgi:hypothetical protein
VEFWSLILCRSTKFNTKLNVRSVDARAPTSSSDVLALASGQKAMAYWLWYQGQSQAKILAWHGFWPGLTISQAKAGPKGQGFWTPSVRSNMVDKIFIKILTSSS